MKTKSFYVGYNAENSKARQGYQERSTLKHMANREVFTPCLRYGPYQYCVYKVEY